MARVRVERRLGAITEALDRLDYRVRINKTSQATITNGGT
jgi:hypothetical protein